MNQQDQAEAFAQDLERLLERYRGEFDLTYHSVVGILYMKLHEICAEAMEDDGEDEEEEEDDGEGEDERDAEEV